MVGRIPSSRTATRKVTDLGKVAKDEYIKLRERYKGEGLTPREAVERAYIELKIESRWYDWKRRVQMRDALEGRTDSGEPVPLTPAEIREVQPNHSHLKAEKVSVESIGSEQMSVPEQFEWAMRQAARVQNGQEPPREFPCDGALFWYQSAVGNRREFEKNLLRSTSPGGDPDNLYLQDSQYQYSEIAKQLTRARDECGSRFLEIENEFRETLDAKKSQRPEPQQIGVDNLKGSS